MSARLVNQVVTRASDILQADRRIRVYTHRRIFDGELIKHDATNGTIEMKVKDGVSHETWLVLIDVEHIEAIEPRWKEAA